MGCEGGKERLTESVIAWSLGVCARPEGREHDNPFEKKGRGKSQVIRQDAKKSGHGKNSRSTLEKGRSSSSSASALILLWSRFAEGSKHFLRKSACIAYASTE